MPPGLRLRPSPGHSPVFRLGRRASRFPPACLFCSYQLANQPRLSRLLPSAAAATASWKLLRREYSTADATSSTPTRPPTPQQARANLEQALKALESQAGTLVNLSRIQLAIRGLQQEAGHESIRVAVYGLQTTTNGGETKNNSKETAQDLLRLLLADPLQTEQPWEAQLAHHDSTKPLIVRIRNPGDGTAADVPRAVRLAQEGSELDEIEVPSAVLQGTKMEFLVLGSSSSLAVPRPAKGSRAKQKPWEETVLVPAVQIPGMDDATPMATPVHRALVVTEGIQGAGQVSALLSSLEQKQQQQDSEILAAVHLRHLHHIDPDDVAGCDFAAYDSAAATEALALFRESVANAKAYNVQWQQSGLPRLARWLKEAGATSRRTDGATTKPPVRALVASVLRHARAAMDDAEVKASGGSSSKTTSPIPANTFRELNTGLASWAERAHAELQSQLDLAFAGQRWRQLGWWKLFWRADDVTMLASGLVSQRFLPQAEQEAVYLAGQIREAAKLAGQDEYQHGAVYPGPIAIKPKAKTQPVSTPTQPDSTSPPTKWPTHITFTRRYLLGETVPALQALADRLVLETLGSSGLAAALAGLTYFSHYGLYESGAIAALGLVWCLGRMQKRWETARQFWEGEVREEGRKAVRAVEQTVAVALDQTRAVATGEADRDRVLRDVQEARLLLDKAEKALAELK